MFAFLKRGHPETRPVQPAPVEPPFDVLTTAGRLARREGQIITVDRLTMDALRAGTDVDLAIDVRRAFGLPLPGLTGGAR